jgi:hypothetical protein
MKEVKIVKKGIENSDDLKKGKINDASKNLLNKVDQLKNIGNQRLKLQQQMNKSDAGFYIENNVENNQNKINFKIT